MLSIALIAGLFAGAACGAIAMAFLAAFEYRRGYGDAVERRDEWRLELATRRAAWHQTRSAA